MSDPAGGLFLFIGPDRARKLQRIQDLERAMRISALDRYQMDAAQANGSKIIAACRQQPAASALRLVVIDQAHRLDAQAVSGLLIHAAAIKSVACVVLLVDTELGVRHPLAQAQAPIVVERFPGGDAPSAKPFAFTDALGRRDTASALAALREQVLLGKDAVELLALVSWQVQRWVAVKRLLAGGASIDKIASVTGLRDWQIQRIQTEVGRHSLASLRGMLERCWQVDSAIRTGRAMPDLALEQLVLELCLPQREAMAGAVTSSR